LAFCAQGRTTISGKSRTLIDYRAFSAIWFYRNTLQRSELHQGLVHFTGILTMQEGMCAVLNGSHRFPFSDFPIYPKDPCNHPDHISIHNRCGLSMPMTLWQRRDIGPDAGKPEQATMAVRIILNPEMATHNCSPYAISGHG
jgi:hypothetical protein